MPFNPNRDETLDEAYGNVDDALDSIGAAENGLGAALVALANAADSVRYVERVGFDLLGLRSELERIAARVEDAIDDLNVTRSDVRDAQQEIEDA